jgi:transporter family-2 protein
MNISNPVFYAIVMILAGTGIPIMAALNAGLGSRIQSPALATIILVVFALLASVVVLFLTPGQITLSLSSSTPIYYYLGGFLFIFYISTISWIAPKFGFANAITFIFIGQIISMCAIDHFGLFNAVQYSFNWQRLLGLLLMISGIFLIVKRA